MVKMINGGGRFQYLPNHVTNDVSPVMIEQPGRGCGRPEVDDRLVTDLRRVNLDLKVISRSEIKSNSQVELRD